VTTKHISDEELTAYLDGEASEADRHRIEAERASNPALRARIAQFEIDTSGIRDAFNTMRAPAFHIAQKQKAASQNGWWKTAAAVALAFGIGLVS
jgi:anti-sigma factor RsiW